MTGLIRRRNWLLKPNLNRNMATFAVRLMRYFVPAGSFTTEPCGFALSTADMAARNRCGMVGNRQGM